jgi:hypothetical protein
MDTTLCKTTEPALALYSEQVRPLRTLQIADTYATAPMEALRPIVVADIQSTINEEFLHASFDDALSERLTALHCQWNQLHSAEYNIALHDHNVDIPITDPIFTVQDTANREHMHYTLQHYILLMCSALILLLAGFDITALLILRMAH